MKKNILFVAGGLAALGLTLVALPGSSANSQKQEIPAADLERKLEEASARLQAAAPALAQTQVFVRKLQGMPGQEPDDVTVLMGEEGPSWLGVETREVTPENVKEFKLPAERGVVVGRISNDSPAAKAGLKENDVITEVNGQRVEGSTQFRRVIRETPAGRSVSLTVWRDGRAQTISATLGKSEENHRMWMNATPGAFAFRMPEVEELPDMPRLDVDSDVLTFLAHPRLGIDAEEIGGQLGAYFGAPEGEGVLVREVNPGSPAEKAGVRAGDVITKLNGDRIRSLGDLREKLASLNSGEKQAKLSVVRNKSEMTLSVDMPEPAKKQHRKLTHSTNI